MRHVTALERDCKFVLKYYGNLLAAKQYQNYSLRLKNNLTVGWNSFNLHVIATRPLEWVLNRQLTRQNALLEEEEELDNIIDD